MAKDLLRLIIFLLVVSTPALAQSISGRVTGGNDGQPLPGVSIVVKGSTSGTITDATGKYMITAATNRTLVFSFIGYKSKEVAIDNRSTVDVALDEDASNINEVVVTAFGIKKEERALGYATAVVNNEALIKTASPNFATALYGKAPGVTINATPGGATSAVSISIRGLASITGNTQPLIVMDGIPIRNGEVRNNDYWGDQRIRGTVCWTLTPPTSKTSRF